MDTVLQGNLHAVPICILAVAEFWTVIVSIKCPTRLVLVYIILGLLLHVYDCVFGSIIVVGCTDSLPTGQSCCYQESAGIRNRGNQSVRSKGPQKVIGVGNWINIKMELNYLDYILYSDC